MPKYLFVCPNGTEYEAHADVREQWAPCPCCGVAGPRNYRAEFLSQSQACDDEIRRSWLGTEIDRNLQAQGRPLDPLAPKDKFEAKAVEKALGRVHIGNDYSMLRPISQRAIERGPTSKPGKIVVSSS